jgi:pimeloyl-ACP methyl ester carboxylesterase
MHLSSGNPSSSVQSKAMNGTENSRPRLFPTGWSSIFWVVLLVALQPEKDTFFTVAAEPAGTFDLETSDGVALRIWQYPAAAEPVVATVLLLHDLEGSHATVEDLSIALQAGGCHVIAPDLRGHGASTRLSHPSRAEKVAELEAKRLTSNDLRMMAATAGGNLRRQATLRGDIETVRNWLRNSPSIRAPGSRLCVIGSGLGGTVGALWTAADWAWRPTTEGAQGQEVNALVLISPSWSVRGLSLSPALQSPAIKQQIPIMLVAGDRSQEADRLFRILKVARPDAWFAQAADGTIQKSDAVKEPSDAHLFSFHIASTLSPDKLACSESGSTVGRLVLGFLKATGETPPDG